MDMTRPVLSSAEKNDLEKIVHDFNLKTNPTRQPQQNLGRDDFLKSLLPSFPTRIPQLRCRTRNSSRRWPSFPHWSR